MDPTAQLEVKPVWAKRRAAVEAKADVAFTKMREKDGRMAPTQWQEAPKNVNTSDKERPLAGNTRGGQFKPRTAVQRVQMTGERKMVGKDRTTGVTAADRKAAGTSNERFFSAAQSQDIIEKDRAGKQ